MSDFLMTITSNHFGDAKFVLCRLSKLIQLPGNKTVRKNTRQFETVAAGTDLLQGNLQVLVHVQCLKQVVRGVLEPHKQVTWGDSLLEAQHLDVKYQHRTAGNPSG